MMKTSLYYFLTAVFFLAALNATAQRNKHTYKFEQLDSELRSPNTYRTASGAPGKDYWQQRADYDIRIELNDENQSVTGSETITYTNNSPDPLSYLWLQLDQNIFEPNSDANLTATSGLDERMSAQQIERIVGSDFDGGFKIKSVKDVRGAALPFTINKTMMRVDLPRPLRTGEKFVLAVDWYYNINDRMKLGGRSGYEYFTEDDNYLYTIAQFFPRMAVYTDYQGWQHKQFLGAGEFTLPFGDYRVSITVPADHIVAATGVLQNPREVLSAEEMRRFEQAQNSMANPVIISTQAEAVNREKTKVKNKKTWVYRAENVRDFGFATSRKFIWDAMAVNIGGKKVMAMSYYPKEGNPLWEQYSTRVVAHTLKVYSKHTIDYPYPVAISVHADQIGMEYPMICFNFGRPEKDGTYSDRVKYGMIGVIIHEVGHNFFPMIINSDERQWTWMDEGLNTFVQFLAEQEWDVNYPSRRGPAFMIVDYMKGEKVGMSPIMTNSEQAIALGPNAYSKPATALNILRETVMGRELFDYAFKEYCRRWAFKHPTPEDFFRTMEDASGVDLDWFWRGWFYTVDHVDINMSDVRWMKLDTKNPEIEFPMRKAEQELATKHVTQEYNRRDLGSFMVDTNPELRDFYNEYDPFEVTEAAIQEYQRYRQSLSEEEKKLLDSQLNFYEITLRNEGGLVMPVILEFTFEDGTTDLIRIPAEIWRKNDEEVSKVFAYKKVVTSIRLDPFRETADVDETNNYWPRRAVPSRFELFKRRTFSETNPMQQKSKQNR